MTILLGIILSVAGLVLCEWLARILFGDDD